jgi:hypothetical protein
MEGGEDCKPQHIAGALTNLTDELSSYFLFTHIWQVWGPCVLGRHVTQKTLIHRPGYNATQAFVAEAIPCSRLIQGLSHLACLVA